MNPQEEDISAVRARLLRRVMYYHARGIPPPDKLRQRLVEVEGMYLDWQTKNALKPKPIDFIVHKAPIDPSVTKDFGLGSLGHVWDKAINDMTILAADYRTQEAGEEAGASSVPQSNSGWSFNTPEVIILMVGLGLALYLNCRS